MLVWILEWHVLCLLKIEGIGICKDFSESKGWRVRASGCDVSLAYSLCDFEQDTTSLNLVLLIPSIGDASEDCYKVY